MSIANEITRIINAKKEIAQAVSKRGTAVDDTQKINSFAQMIENAPYAVKGYFTPEEDTSVFSVSGLPFAPTVVYMVCNELFSAGISNSVIMLSHGNNYRGVKIGFNDSLDSVSTSFISEVSTLCDWSGDGYSIDFSRSSSANTRNSVFKAGYTYVYFVSGGFSQ